MMLAYDARGRLAHISQTLHFYLSLSFSRPPLRLSPSAASVLPKACADGNAAALDKALEAMATLLARCSDQLASRMVGAASGNIVTKCLGARPGTAAKGTECLLLFVEAECGDKVVVSCRALLLGRIDVRMLRRVRRLVVAACAVLCSPTPTATEPPQTPPHSTTSWRGSATRCPRWSSAASTRCCRSSGALARARCRRPSS